MTDDFELDREAFKAVVEVLGKLETQRPEDPALAALVIRAYLGVARQKTFDEVVRLAGDSMKQRAAKEIVEWLRSDSNTTLATSQAHADRIAEHFLS